MRRRDMPFPKPITAQNPARSRGDALVAPRWRGARPATWIAFALLLALAMGVIAAERAMHGGGRLHRVLAAAYQDVRSAQRQRTYAAQVSPLTVALPEEPLALYRDKLEGGWQNWSWAACDFAATDRTWLGKTAIRMTPEDWKAVYLHHDPVTTDGYGILQFYLSASTVQSTPKGDSPQIPSLRVRAADANGAYGGGVLLKSYCQAVRSSVGETWLVARIPLTDLGISKISGVLAGIVIQAEGRERQADVLLDDIALLPDTTRAPQPTEITVPIAVDLEQDPHPISPLIYGMAFAPPDYLQDLRLGSNRWGGNDKTRYNWVQGNACNAARDWRFANRTASDAAGLVEGPSSGPDRFVRQNRAAGTATLLTVPTIGWVAKDTDSAHASEAVPGEGGPPLTSVRDTAKGAIAGYDPAANRDRTSMPSFARKGKPFTLKPTLAAGAVYQDEWIYHLTQQFGAADKGGVGLYAMDNEPDLWDGTHTDVHPVQLGYDGLLAQFLSYARAVKEVDPSAKITGPVSWGWTGYQYSPLDRGKDNYHTHADRVRHGDEPFLLWFLKQARVADSAEAIRRPSPAGRRSLDVLDVHYYPQGTGLYTGTATDSETRARRIRATRSLWDPSYTDESWIAKPIRLLPMLQEWIAKGYPGTRIGITEWNFGGDTDISGALAIAETLGIYGRENVYVANYWVYPPKNSPGYLAFKLYRNPDDHGHGFGNLSRLVRSRSPELVSCYAATEAATGVLTLVLVNKMPKTTALVPLSIGMETNASMRQGSSAWRLDSKTVQKLHTCEESEVWGSSRDSGSNGLQVKLPPYSVTLIRLPGLAGHPKLPVLSPSR
ncbi:MAG: glycoside hydrolase family 44 protein [Cytophagales bacterium]|nr:glycoside hydrolase family 44 protein [Armatimonadota bacterium]